MKKSINLKNYRKAVFVIVYKIENNNIFYLLLKRKLHWNGWEFPKGGIEPNESFKTATLRELKEETGFFGKEVLLNKLKNHNISGKYLYNTSTKKQRKFIGQTFNLYSIQVDPRKNKKIKLDKKEHSNYKWVDKKTALKLLTWSNQRRCLRVVHKKISE